MEYRRLGRSGVKLSTIGLGSWLTYGASVDRARSVALVQSAYEKGVNFFDTANVYHRGAAEEVVGEALRAFPRDSYVLATKVFFPMGDGPNDRGLSRKHIMEQCHQSLKRLGTDYIDLYQCHRYDPETPLDETLRALDDLITQGKVLYVGVSQWSAVQIADALRLAERLNLDPIVSNQPLYNILHRDIERDVLPLCAREGIGQVVYSPLAQGVLTGKYRPGQPLPPGSRATDPSSNMFMGRLLTDEVLSKVERLAQLAREAGLTPAQMALAWVLRRPEVTSAIIGATRPEQLDENLAAAGVRLPDEVVQAIDRITGFAPDD
ncbi:MAG: aldo/keto reductase family protein [Limnochordaceae bacterium]|nr:aldo/keto reductase family protein [Limnochordaceae bacterium]